MIKLKFGPFSELNWNIPMNTPPFNKALLHHGIEVVKSGQDVSFCDIHTKLEDGPVIAFDRRDTSALTPEAIKRGEENQNVIGYAIPCLALETEKSTAGHAYDYKGNWPPRTDKPIKPVTTMLWNRLGIPWTKNLPTPEKDIKASPIS